MQSQNQVEKKKTNLFHSAILLARKGYYDEATLAVQQCLQQRQCNELEATELQAKIYSQQGRYLEAEACWEAARKLDPDNPEYDRAILRIRKPAPGPNRIPILLSSSVILLLLVIQGWQTLMTNPRLAGALDSQLASTKALENAIIAVDDRMRAFSESVTESNRSLGQLMGEVLTVQQVSQQDLQKAGQRLHEHYETQSRRLAMLEIAVEYWASRYRQSQQDLQAAIAAADVASNQNFKALDMRLAEIKTALETNP